MNGYARSRRASSPLRLTLAHQPGGSIDGAWWPRSALIAAELPDLVGALHRRLGEIVDIRVNWSATEGQLDLASIAMGGRPILSDGEPPRPRLMIVSGQVGRVKLLVVPSMTSQALGMMVMRTAAGMPTSCGDGDARIFETAQLVMRFAEMESAKLPDEVTKEQGTL